MKFLASCNKAVKASRLHYKTLFLAMRLTAILLLGACLQSAAGGNAQGITLSMKNVSVVEVFKNIEKQTGFTFVYFKEDVQKIGNITVEVNKASLQTTLAICFKDQPLSYTIEDKFIVIRAKSIQKEEEMTVLINIKGKVMNENGQPISGATIVVKGTKKVNTTNEMGEFLFEGIEENSVLVVSHISFETQEIKVNGNIEILIKLKLNINELNAVSINTGYQTLKPNQIAGSVTSITKEQLDQRIAPDIISKLEGITNGLVFNKKIDGRNALRIRGESTILANPDPLVVVDNFPYNGDINNINPNDVENITILKDAAAASIWGVQAGNGVIVITTKRGKVNQPLRIEVNTNITIGSKADIFYKPQIAPSDYIDFETFLFSKGYYNSALNDINKRVVSPIIEILNKRKLGLISAMDSATQIDAYRNTDLRKDLHKYIFQNSISQQYQVNLSGGSNKASYYFSAGYDKNMSTVVGVNNTRITFNSQTTFRPLSNLELNTGLFYNESSNSGNTSSSIPNAYPYMQLVDEHGNQLSIPRRRKIFEDTISNHGFLDWKYYPLRERNYTKNSSKAYEMRLLTTIKYNFLKVFSASVIYQYQKNLGHSRQIMTPKSYFIRDNYNTFAIVNNGNFIGSNYNGQQLNRGVLDISNNDLVSHSGRASLNYNQRWANHMITGVLGVDIREVSTEANSSRLYGYDEATGSYIASPSLYGTYTTYPSLTSSTYASPGDGLSTAGTLNRTRSYYGITSYTYKDRYSLQGSIRFDGSNYFGVKTNLKTVPLWSIGTKWDISKERFFDLKQFSFLSIRTSYGYNGNLAQNLAALTTIAYNKFPDSYTGLPYAVINNIPNPELRWEKTSHFNIGVDFSSQNSRLTGSIEYFKKSGNDLIGDSPIDPTTGISQIRGNFSGMKSSGIDIQVISKNIDRKFKWNSSAIFNYSSEKVTRYDLPISGSYAILLAAYSNTNSPQVGKPLYGLYSYKWAGLDPVTGDPRIYVSDTVNKTYTSATTNTIKITDLVFSGRYNPLISGALLNTFSWNGFNLQLNITYKLKYYFRRESINFNTLASNWERGHSDYALRWRGPGDESNTHIPSLTYPFNTTREQFYQNANVLVEKGDHIRLQFINFGYTFEKPESSRLFFKTVQVNFYINNLGILWRANDKRIDPDYPYVNFPPSRNYSIAIKTVF